MSRSIRDADIIYKKARIKASESNDKLRSREEASELLDVSVGSLLNYETGVCKQISADVTKILRKWYQSRKDMINIPFS
jgi:hypothetical protein